MPNIANNTTFQVKPISQTLEIKTQYEKDGLRIFVKSELLEKFAKDISNGKTTELNDSYMYSIKSSLLQTNKWNKTEKQGMYIRDTDLRRLHIDDKIPITSPLFMEGMKDEFGASVTFKGFYDKKEIHKYVKDLFIYSEKLTKNIIIPYYKGREERIKLEKEAELKTKALETKQKRIRTITIRKAITNNRYQWDSNESMYRINNESGNLFAWISSNDLAEHENAIIERNTTNERST